MRTFFIVVGKVSRKQHIGVVLAALAVVLLSVLLTLYATGALDTVLGLKGAPQYKNVTFTDAVLACKKQVREEYANMLTTLVVDDHSSRYEDKMFLYKIFMEADVKLEDAESPVLFYINCFVKAGNGRIADFESFEDSDDGEPRAIDGTNMFGFPLKH